MNPSGSGGTDLACCLSPKSESGGFNSFDHTRIGNGTYGAANAALRIIRLLKADWASWVAAEDPQP
jgi:hypothetical protein